MEPWRQCEVTTGAPGASGNALGAPTWDSGSNSADSLHLRLKKSSDDGCEDNPTSTLLQDQSRALTPDTRGSEGTPSAMRGLRTLGSECGSGYRPLHVGWYSI